ncbi:FlgO family outer membrane protein [Parashewanella curva]|uniref:FlgO family outer membrane protein n=1 Tax=Parashewanella curva TaxID=2338552 RepID=UPI0010598F2A|nr:FlgO family outer membrane protein [Parashewanella curva]
MKRILVTIGCVLLSACSYHVTITKDAHKQKVQELMMMPPSWAANVVLSLSNHHSALPKDVPLVVTTPVSANDFNERASFAAQIQQELMTTFSRAGYTVADPNVTDRLMIKSKGEFVLSRDWQELSGNLEIGLLVVTTYSLGLSDIKLNTRVINIENNQVIAAESSAIPVTELEQFLSPAEKVVEKNGMLYRNEATGMEPVSDKQVKP